MATKTFQKFLDNNNLDIEIILTDKVTRTAEEAAETHNVPVSNIAKSLVVKIGKDFELFITPGDKRLDLDQIKSQRSANKVRMANADEVKIITGYSIGGVPPFGHQNNLKLNIVDGFNSEEKIFAAAGAHNAVFETNLKQLTNLVKNINS